MKTDFDQVPFSDRRFCTERPQRERGQKQAVSLAFVVGSAVKLSSTTFVTPGVIACPGEDL